MFCEKDRESISDNRIEKRYPEAITIPNEPLMKTNGKYKTFGGFPEGAIVHYTAGNQSQSGESAIAFANKQGHAYFFIDEDGQVYQQFELNRWGSHAGKSLCPETDRENVSRYYVGIEIACAGLLEKDDLTYKTWFGKKVHPSNVRQGTWNEHHSTGYFEKYTFAQEKALVDLLVWMVTTINLKPHLILGHYEVAGFRRKYDPCGSLSMGMEGLRQKVINEVLKIKDISK